MKLSFSFRNLGTNTYLVYTIQKDDTLDAMSLGMLTNNKIAGLASTTITQNMETNCIKYDVSKKISVKEFFAGAVSKKHLLGVFSAIVDAILSAQDYMINSDSIVLNTDYIFIDTSTCETILICLPIINKSEVSIDLEGFLKNIMFNTQFDQTENCDHVAKIINFLNSSSDFSIIEFKELIDSIGKEKSTEEKTSMGSVATQMNAVPQDKKETVNVASAVQQNNNFAKPNQPTYVGNSAPMGNQNNGFVNPNQPAPMGNSVPMNNPSNVNLQNNGLVTVDKKTQKEMQKARKAAEKAAKKAQKEAEKAAKKAQKQSKGQNTPQQNIPNNGFANSNHPMPVGNSALITSPNNMPPQNNGFAVPNQPTPVNNSVSMGNQNNVPATPVNTVAQEKKEVEKPVAPVVQNNVPVTPVNTVAQEKKEVEKPVAPVVQNNVPATPVNAVAQEKKEVEKPVAPVVQNNVPVTPVNTVAQEKKEVEKPVAPMPQNNGVAPQANSMPQNNGFATPNQPMQKVDKKAQKAAEKAAKKAQKEAEKEAKKAKKQLKGNNNPQQNVPNNGFAMPNQPRYSGNSAPMGNQNNMPPQNTVSVTPANSVPQNNVPVKPVNPVPQNNMPVKPVNSVPQNNVSAKSVNPTPMQSSSIKPTEPQNFAETTVLGAGAIGETTVLSADQLLGYNVAPVLVRRKTDERVRIEKDVYKIGKEKSYVDFFIADNTAISRRHANIIKKDRKYYIVDTDSTNHTFVNGKMIPSNVETPLEHGDMVRLANEEFEFKLY